MPSTPEHRHRRRYTHRLPKRGGYTGFFTCCLVTVPILVFFIILPFLRINYDDATAASTDNHHSRRYHHHHHHHHHHHDDDDDDDDDSGGGGDAEEEGAFLLQPLDACARYQPTAGVADLAGGAVDMAADCVVGDRLVGARCVPDTGHTVNGTSIALIDGAVAPCNNFYRYANGAWFDAIAASGRRRGARFFDAAARQNAATMARVEADIAGETPPLPPDSVLKEARAFYATCAATYGYGGGGGFAAEQAARDAIDALILKMFRRCLPSEASKNIMCATGMWLRRGIAAPLRVEAQHSPRRAGERFVYVEPAGAGLTANLNLDGATRSALVKAVLGTKDRADLVAAVIAIEDALIEATDTALTAEARWSDGGDLASYVADTETGLDAHLFEPSASRLNWGALHRELAGVEHPGLAKKLSATTHWARSLAYLDALATLERRFSQVEWGAYFVFTIRYQAVEFMPASFKRPGLVLRAAAAGPRKNRVHAERGPAYMRSALFPWSMLRQPLWQSRRLDHVQRVASDGTGVRARCLEQAQIYLSEVIDVAFSNRAITPENRARIVDTIKSVIEARKRMIMRSGPQKLSSTGRAALVAKLDAIEIRVGTRRHATTLSRVGTRYPMRDTHMLNVVELKVRLVAAALVGVLLVPSEEPFLMRTAVVNAYYNPRNNSADVPSGMTRPPFFHPHYNGATILATLGMIIGHEIGHATDREGRRFDLNGVARDNWLSADDRRAFAAADACFSIQYTDVGPESGAVESGSQTVTEDTADNVGIHAALYALKASLGLADHAPFADAGAAGIAAGHNFFLEFAQMWAVKQTPARERAQLAGDPHALAQFRVNKALANVPEFLDLYGCTGRRVHCMLATGGGGGGGGQTK
jgi:hypothetical protein